MAARPDLSKLSLRGDGMKQDSLETEGKPVVIENVDRYRVMDAMFEGVRVVLAHRGEKHSPEYLQGISGSAFRIAGPCPCAPTCSSMMGPEELVRLLGYEVEPVSLCGKGARPEKDVVPLVARVKKEIRAGRPVLVWHALTNAEWDVVCGFDEEKRHFLGRGSYAGLEGYATAEETRTAKCLDICPALGAIFIGKKTGTFHARAAELAALEEGVRHARSAPQTPQSWGASGSDRSHPWRFQEGIACYGAWVRSFRSEPERVPGAGDRYPLGIYWSTHRAAAGFLRELAPKYPEARAFLEEGAGHFAAEADALGELHDKLFQGWQGWKASDPEKSARAATLLTTARRHYALGIESMEYALKRVDPARVAAASRPARVRRGLEAAPGLERNAVAELEAALQCKELADAPAEPARAAATREAIAHEQAAVEAMRRALHAEGKEPR